MFTHSPATTMGSKTKITNEMGWDVLNTLLIIIFFSLFFSLCLSLVGWARGSATDFVDFILNFVRCSWTTKIKKMNCDNAFARQFRDYDSNWWLPPDCLAQVQMNNCAGNSIVSPNIAAVTRWEYSVTHGSSSQQQQQQHLHQTKNIHRRIENVSIQNIM